MSYHSKRKQYQPSSKRKIFKGKRFSSTNRKSMFWKGIFIFIALLLVGFLLIFALEKGIAKLRLWKLEQEIAAVRSIPETIIDTKEQELEIERKSESSEEDLKTKDSEENMGGDRSPQKDAAEQNEEESSTELVETESPIEVEGGNRDETSQGKISQTPYQWLISSLPENVPPQKVLPVPFVCQNPFQDQKGWEWHDESCEEAAAYQVILFLEGKSAPDPQVSHELFLDMIEWQEDPSQFGDHIDLYTEDMRIFIRDYFGYDDEEVIWIPELSQDLIKKLIAANHPIIVPLNGTAIQNPFYPEPGYHMLTVIGYTADRVITNEVGTKRGEKYPYKYDIFLTANQAEGGGGIVVVPKG